MKFDIECETFDQYFTRECANLTQAQKDNLPAEVIKDLFIRTGKLNFLSLDRFGFLGKVYILSKATGKKINISIEGEEGINPKDFEKEIKNNGVSMESAERLVSSGSFVVSDRQLSETMAFANNIAVSPAYSYLTRALRLPPNKVQEGRDEFNFICRFLINYEDNKVKWQRFTGLNIHEFLVLLALHHGKDIPSSSIYRDVYKTTFIKSSARIRTAVVTLCIKRYVTRTGVTRKAKVQITSLGAAKLQEIIMKYSVTV